MNSKKSIRIIHIFIFQSFVAESQGCILLYHRMVARKEQKHSYKAKNTKARDFNNCIENK